MSKSEMKVQGTRSRYSGRRSVTDVAMTSILTALGVYTLGCVVGCAAGPSESEASHPRSVNEILADAPSWVTSGCRAFWSDAEKRRQVVCGIGSAASSRNQVAAQETAIARARAAIARSLEVTIESLVRLDERGSGEADLDTISHQLSSISLKGVQLESVWRAETGEVHALVSLDLARVQKTVRNSRSLSPTEREDLARRAADAFSALDAAFAQESGEAGGDPGKKRGPSER